MQNNDIICPICDRETPENFVEKHHLIPKTEKGRETIKICVSCGDVIHKFIEINSLRDKYNTIEAIVLHPKIIKWKKWISKRPKDFNICQKAKKRK